MKTDYAYTTDPITAARLAAARAGDEQEFAALAEPYRRELQAHCYRIMGSPQDAEDLVQETMLRAWQRLNSYEGRAPFRAWMYRIATNACLDALDRRRARRRLPTTASPEADPRKPIAPPLEDAVWLEPYPDEWLNLTDSAGPEARYTAHESVRLAFLAALQALPPRQRAVVIMRDVLDWAASEVATCLEMTVPAVNSALHRGRTTLAANYEGEPVESLSARSADESTRRLLDMYIDAWETADVNRLVALLKHDAVLLMPPSVEWYRGREAIGLVMGGLPFAGDSRGRWKLRATQGANGSPAFGFYERSSETGVYEGRGLQVLDISGGQIVEIATFFNPALLRPFGLPQRLEK